MADDTEQSLLHRFLFPRLNRRYLLRLCAVAAAAYLFFGYVCIPCVIEGGSMKPTYSSFGVTFCWCPSLWFRQAQVGDIVAAKYFGRKVLLLKRVVALEGDVVEFRHGQLHVNGKLREGQWPTLGPCDWELPPRTVEPGNVYLVGDNRSMPMESHVFGQLSAKRLMGKPIW